MQPLDTIVFETPLVRAARFRCGARDPRFRDSGPATNCAVVFPRTAVWIRNSGSRSFVADPSLATIYNPGQEYTRNVISSDGDRCEWFAVSTEVAIEIALSFDKRSADKFERPFSREFAPIDHDLYLAQRTTFTRLERRSIESFEAEESIIGLVTAVIGRAYAATRSPRSVDRDWQLDLVERAKASLSRTLCNRQSLGDLARELDVSPFHLCRVFREHTGRTLHDFKTDLRLRCALEMLTDSPSDLSRIAFECGFSSHSHFTSAMKSRIGRTPSAVRASLS